MFSSVTLRTDLQRTSFEAVWLEVFPISAAPINIHIQPLIVACIYRPPSQTSSELSHFCNTLEDSLQIVSSKPASVFLTGDFNARHSDWCPSDSTSPTGQTLQEIFHCFGLSQMVSFPTHVPNTQRHGSCLDLIITNSPESICDIEPSAPLGLSDHLQILCSLRFPLLSTNPLRNNTPSQYLQWNPSRPIRYNFNFRKAPPQTWDRINEHIQSYDWSPLSVMPDVDVALAYFEHTLQYIFDLYLPHHAPTHRPTSPSSDPPWMTPALRSAVKRKHDAFSVSRKYPTADNLAAYRRQRNLVKDLSRHDYRSYIRSIKSTLSSNDHPSLSQFVRRLRKPTSTSAPITSMQRPDGSIAHDTRDIANLLNVHFTTVAPSADPRWCVPSLAEHSAILSSLDSFQTSPSTVRTVINKLKINKSPSFDGLPYEVLTSGTFNFVSSLHHLQHLLCKRRIPTCLEVCCCHSHL